jgi:hypothetical protein
VAPEKRIEKTIKKKIWGCRENGSKRRRRQLQVAGHGIDQVTQMYQILLRTTTTEVNFSKTAKQRTNYIFNLYDVDVNNVRGLDRMTKVNSFNF